MIQQWRKICVQEVWCISCEMWNSMINKCAHNKMVLRNMRIELSWNLQKTWFLHKIGTWILGRSGEHDGVHQKLMSNQGFWFQDPWRNMEW
jgi:hypothetical protein